MMKTISVLSIWVFCFLASGAEKEPLSLSDQLRQAAENQTPESKLYEAAMIYLKNCVSEQEHKEWTAKWESRLQDAVRGDVTEDTYVRDFAFNWCNDHKNEFKDPEKADRKNVIFLAKLYVYIWDKKIGLPTKVREKLTPDVADKVVDFLVNKAPKLTNSKPAGMVPD